MMSLSILPLAFSVWHVLFQCVPTNQAILSYWLNCLSPSQAISI